MQLISRKGVGGKKAPTIQLSFLLIEAIIQRILAEQWWGGWVGLHCILNHPRYSIPVTLVHAGPDLQDPTSSSTSGAWWLKFLFWCFLTIYNNQFSTPDKIYRSGDLTSTLLPKLNYFQGQLIILSLNCSTFSFIKVKWEVKGKGEREGGGRGSVRFERIFVQDQSSVILASRLKFKITVWYEECVLTACS